MAGVRSRGEAIRQFIVESVATHPSDIVRFTTSQFDISRQAVSTHINRLIEQGLLSASGKTRSRTYKLCAQVANIEVFNIDGLEEDVVWRKYVLGELGKLPDNALNIWHYGFTEMLNNAIDHSQGEIASVSVKKDPARTQIMVSDDGVGIFRQIQETLDLNDERHAVLELAKGKLTTDPDNHTGEGIFFSSRMFDDYAILSGGVYFSHEHNKPEDWIMERKIPQDGTTVFMQIANNSARTVKSVFDKFASGEELAFDKTVVPVSLARYGNERLVSRSQAKRLLARVDKFKIVILDFSGIDQIGQAFADEVFRVFKSQHPENQLYFSQANTDVENIIIRALGT